MKFIAFSLGFLRYVLWLLVAIQLLYWTLQFSAPEPIAPRPMPPKATFTGGYDWNLFAFPQSAESMPFLQLLGVVSVANGTDAGSRAAILVRGKHVVVAPNEKIVPGVLLKKVNPGGIEVEFKGAEQAILLPKQMSGNVVVKTSKLFQTR